MFRSVLQSALVIAAVCLISSCQNTAEPVLRAESASDSSVPTSVSLISRTADPRDLPSSYFAGFGTQWFVNIHNWRDGGLGKSRYFEPLSSDLSRYRQAGANVMRLQINMDGAIFWSECNWRADGQYDVHNACYDRAYENAGKQGWSQQIAALETEAHNPVLDQYVRAARRLQDNGFHVMLAPSDFFWGDGSNWITSTSDPLLHVYLERDNRFQDYYVALMNRLVASMVDGGLNNFSLQTLNEPRFCSDGRPNLRAWSSLERRIIDGARTAAPGLHIVSSAVCTAADQPLSRETSYRSLGRYLPHHDVGNITYALHMRNPRLLHIADHQSFGEGTVLRYPYQPIPATAGLNDQTRREIEIYNRVRPDADFYTRIFQEIASIAQRRGDRIIVTEWSISKPDYGLPREDRVALVQDVLRASRATGIPIIYNGLLGRDGLSSSPDNVMRPSHDFDPQILEAFGSVNR